MLKLGKRMCLWRVFTSQVIRDTLTLIHLQLIGTIRQGQSAIVVLEMVRTTWYVLHLWLDYFICLFSRECLCVYNFTLQYMSCQCFGIFIFKLSRSNIRTTLSLSCFKGLYLIICIVVVLKIYSWKKEIKLFMCCSNYQFIL